MIRFMFLLLAALALVAPRGYSEGAALRPGETFEMRLSGMPLDFAQEFALQYTIAEDGMVGIPLIGQMKAAGLTASQFAKSIERKLVADKIFTNPTVVLNLPMQARFVTVGGGVRAPQTVPWTPDLTLSTAVKRVGGPSEWGNTAKTKLTRDGKSAIFNLKKVDKDPTQNPKLLPNDEIEVAE